MRQEHKFFMFEQERIDGLTRLLIQIFQQEGINLVPRGGARTTVDRGFDFDVYDLFVGLKQVGHYEFELNKGRYCCILDLTGVPEENYRKINEIVEKEFPEIKPI